MVEKRRTEFLEQRSMLWAEEQDVVFDLGPTLIC